MCVPHTQINWAALEAIGTIAAAIVALGLGLYGERISRWWRRPKRLKLATGSELWHEESIRNPPDGEPPAGCSWMWPTETVSLKVLNPDASKGAATDIRVRVLRIFRGDEKTSMREAPVTLCWPALSHARVHPCLSPSDFEFLDLFQLKEKLQGPRTLHIPGSPIELTQGEYRIKLTLYSSSAPPDKRTLRVSFGHHRDGSPYYISVREA